MIHLGRNECVYNYLSSEYVKYVCIGTISIKHSIYSPINYIWNSNFDRSHVFSIKKESCSYTAQLELINQGAVSVFDRGRIPQHIENNTTGPVGLSDWYTGYRCKWGITRRFRTGTVRRSRGDGRRGGGERTKGVLHVSRWNPKLEGQPHKLSKLLASQELLTEGISPPLSSCKLELAETRRLPSNAPGASTINYVKHFIKHPRSSG